MGRRNGTTRSVSRAPAGAHGGLGDRLPGAAQACPRLLSGNHSGWITGGGAGTFTPLLTPRQRPAPASHNGPQASRLEVAMSPPKSRKWGPGHFIPLETFSCFLKSDPFASDWPRPLPQRQFGGGWVLSSRVHARWGQAGVAGGAGREDWVGGAVRTERRLRKRSGSEVRVVPLSRSFGLCRIVPCKND